MRTISSNMTVVSGEDVLLHCQGEGDPAPRVQWLSPNGDVVRVTPSSERTISRTSAYWSIRSITVAKSGLYKCEAVNAGGSTFSTTCINVVASAANKNQPPSCALPTTVAVETTVVTTERSRETTAQGQGQGYEGQRGNSVGNLVTAADDLTEHKDGSPVERADERDRHDGKAAESEESDDPFKDFDDNRKSKNEEKEFTTTTSPPIEGIVDNHIPHNHVTPPTPSPRHHVTSSAHGGHVHVVDIVTLTSATAAAAADANSSATLGKLREAEMEDTWHVRLGSAQVAAIVACVCFVTLVAVTSVVVTLACFARRRKRFDIQSRNARNHIRWDTIRQPANV